MRRFLLVVIIVLISRLLMADDQITVNQQPVKNIIFMIGDGMGINQVAGARIKAYGADGRLNMETLPVTGLLKTHSIDDLITDSGASATALSTGYKTRNKMIGMSADTTRVITIMEAARDGGLSTGLVVTSSITHATPACFAAHVPNRYTEQEIARQLVASGTDVMLGGGKKFFLPKSAGGDRKDALNLLDVAAHAGYDIVLDKTAFEQSSGSKILGLFAENGLLNKDNEPSLAELTKKAIGILSQNKKGFFLMVEGSQIDWAGHDNQFAELVKQVLSFDEAIGVALAFAEKNAETLVVVTADHETGGMSIRSGKRDGSQLKIDWISTDHTGQMVPVFAAGSNAYLFTGVKDNTDIPKVFARLLGIENFPRKIEVAD